MCVVSKSWILKHCLNSKYWRFSTCFFFQCTSAVLWNQFIVMMVHALVLQHLKEQNNISFNIAYRCVHLLLALSSKRISDIKEDGGLKQHFHFRECFFRNIEGVLNYFRIMLVWMCWFLVLPLTNHVRLEFFLNPVNSVDSTISAFYGYDTIPLYSILFQWNLWHYKCSYTYTICDWLPYL